MANGLAYSFVVSHQLSVVDVDDSDRSAFVKLDVVGASKETHNVRNWCVQECFERWKRSKIVQNYHIFKVPSVRFV